MRISVPYQSISIYFTCTSREKLLTALRTCQYFTCTSLEKLQTSLRTCQYFTCTSLENLQTSLRTCQYFTYTSVFYVHHYVQVIILRTSLRTFQYFTNMSVILTCNMFPLHSRCHLYPLTPLPYV